MHRGFFKRNDEDTMLQKRLQTVLNLIESVSTIADVGTDHGWLAIALYKANKAKKVIAIDVNKGPLESAKRAISLEGLDEVIECRLGNGLAVTHKGEVDCAIMCGMGGFLMKEIIENGPELLPYYILQPQSGRAQLKQFLVSLGYTILDEVCVEENRHYYDIWVVKKCHTKDPIYSGLSLESPLWEHGAILYEKKDALWISHMEKQRKQAEKIVRAMKLDTGNIESAKKGRLEQYEALLKLEL